MKFCAVSGKGQVTLILLDVLEVGRRVYAVHWLVFSLWGSGNALRWVDNAALRDKMNQVVDGIDECKQANGFIMAYKETDTLEGENPDYVRSWLTHGLIEASVAGNKKALPLIRDHQDWFNHCEYLPQVRNSKLGYQGMMPNTRTYFTSMGKQRDIEVVQKYYQEDWWPDRLINGDEEAIYKRTGAIYDIEKYENPYPHCYEITAFEAYLDLYVATGISKYLDAMKIFHASSKSAKRYDFFLIGAMFLLCDLLILSVIVAYS